jgi:hypothetical protein
MEGGRSIAHFHIDFGPSINRINTALATAISWCSSSPVKTINQPNQQITSDHDQLVLELAGEDDGVLGDGQGHGGVTGTLNPGGVGGGATVGQGSEDGGVTGTLNPGGVGGGATVGQGGEVGWRVPSPTRAFFFCIASQARHVFSGPKSEVELVAARVEIPSDTWPLMRQWAISAAVSGRTSTEFIAATTASMSNFVSSHDWH